MNNRDFTAYGLRNIDKPVICFKSKKLVLEGFDTGFFEYKHGDKKTFVGFICCKDEQSVIVESENGGQDCIDYEEFAAYFEILQPTLSNQPENVKYMRC